MHLFSAVADGQRLCLSIENLSEDYSASAYEDLLCIHIKPIG